MKDTSKAQWPDTMRIEGPHDIKVGGYRIHNTCRIWNEYDLLEVSVSAESRKIAEHRALQICALPEMVALLEYLDNDKEVWMNQQDRDTIRAIRRKIGEVG